ncbi:hypothetical protein SALBM217S_06830 [Streptomyces griseoloalbus]
MFFCLPSRPSLPAEATTTTFRSIALRTASARAEVWDSGLVVSWEMLMTSAPRATAWSMARAMLSESPLLSASFWRMGMMVAFGARPTNPVPSRGRAAMMPATLVPCPTWSSVGSPPLPPASRSSPAALSTAPASCGFLSSTPVSMTATRTPLPLSVPCHSSSSRTRWSDQGRALNCRSLG